MAIRNAATSTPAAGINGASNDDDGGPVGRLFDGWADSGRAELMEVEHGTNVRKFLGTVTFDSPFSFLDIGCGNGWVVRMIHDMDSCKRAVGIDKSGGMITHARDMSPDGASIRFVHTDVESWRTRSRFDVAFSMESLYYADSVGAALARIRRLLKPGGRFFCGTDFYTDNRATARWAKEMRVDMHLYSKRQWMQMFRDAGFHTTARNIKDPKNRKKWKRQWGTLFITGTRPATTTAAEQG